MKTAEQRKTIRYHILEGCLHCILLTLFIPAGLRLFGTSHILIGISTLLVVGTTVLVKIAVVRQVQKNIHWYCSILDTIPFMMHATDMDMNWIFMNKATADFLQLDREQMMGKHCSNWNAVICNTDRCSAQCLRNGKPTTFFEQNGLDLRVDTNWLLDKKSNRIGYVEVVQDISSMVKVQKEQENMVAEVRRMYESLLSAAGSSDQSSQILAQGSVEQAATMEQLSATVTEVTTEVQKNLQKAQEAAVLASAIEQDAARGSVQMQEVFQAMDQIKEANYAINKVIKVIDDIAFHTSILALNASVEAAHAGDRGRGFAVVAGEVRKLAEKSAEAARTSGELIQDSINKAETGTRLSGETASFLGKIIEDIQCSNSIAGEIAQSSQRQSSAIVQINDGIECVAHVVQKNSEQAQESAEISKRMNQQATHLSNLLNGMQHSGVSTALAEQTGMKLAL